MTINILYKHHFTDPTHIKLRKNYFKMQFVNTSFKTQIFQLWFSSYVICVIFIVKLQLERWEASIQDYQIMVKGIPEDYEVNKALLEAQAELKKRRGGS